MVMSSQIVSLPRAHKSSRLKLGGYKVDLIFHSNQSYEENTFSICKEKMGSKNYPKKKRTGAVKRNGTE
jgi:hypothetical protein